MHVPQELHTGHRNTYRLEAAFRPLAPLALTAGGPGRLFAETAGVAARLRNIPYLMRKEGYRVFYDWLPGKGKGT
jgi:hypothetical protein